MSLSVTSGIDGVPDGLAMWTESTGGCTEGCFIRVDLSDSLVVSGTVNQADFVIELLSKCQPAACFESDTKTVWSTESYYNSTDSTGRGEESFWFAADFIGSTGSGTNAANERYMTVLQESALAAIRATGQFHDLKPCQDGFIANGDPDASSGCNPHENRYGHMSASVAATLFSIHDKGAGSAVAELFLNFEVKEKSSGFCNMFGAFSGGVSAIPMGTAASTGFGVASYLIDVACG